VVKSILPDQPVVITTLPRDIASMSTSPRPSDRCVDTITSALA